MLTTVIAIGSDNTVRLDALQNAETGVYINTATVVYSLKDSTGAIFGGLNGVSMPYVNGSAGRYEGNIPHSATANMTNAASFTVQITGTYVSTQIFRQLNCIAGYP